MPDLLMTMDGMGWDGWHETGTGMRESCAGREIKVSWIVSFFPSFLSRFTGLFLSSASN
jgi:hypothetical protein